VGVARKWTWVRHHFGSKEALRDACDAYALQRYLVRSMVDGSPAAASLFDQMVELAEQWIARHNPGISADPRAYAAVLVGMYPHFYTASGSDRTFLPGGRCEGVKKVDQRRMVEKIDELNGIIERNARRNGFLSANPNPRFDGHELCGGGTEWINGVLSDGKFHPTASGQQAIAEAVLAKLADDGFQRFTVLPQKKVTYSFVVGSPKQFISLVTG
jgi:hypothetical protein